MSTKSDFIMFSEMYDNIYREADTSTAPGMGDVSTSGTPDTVTSPAPATGTAGVSTGPISSALMSLQSELQKAGLGSHPEVIQHVQGLTGIIQGK
jgi:hypothetical protein